MFRLKITDMRILAKIYSFRLNDLPDRKDARDNLSYNFYGEQLEFITKICVC